MLGGVLLELAGADLAYILTAAALAACAVALAIARPARWAPPGRLGSLSL